MRIERKWAMPNKRTFTIKPIRNLIIDEGDGGGIMDWVDPFPFQFKEDALSFLARYPDGHVNRLLFDPPYTPRQLKECYDNIGQSLHDTTSRVWAQWKDEIARVIKPAGKCISFGFSSNGLGKGRGFEITRILLVAHGNNHNDTICTVEMKIQETLE